MVGMCFFGSPVHWFSPVANPFALPSVSSSMDGLKVALVVVACLLVPAAHAQTPEVVCGEGERVFAVFGGGPWCLGADTAAALERLGWPVELVGQPSNNVWYPQTSDTQKGGWSSGGSLVLKSTDSLVALDALPATVMDADNIGLAVGGAQDVNNFRANIKEGYLPLATDITPEGLFYDYYFETADPDCQDLFCPTYSKALLPDPFSGKVGDAWLSVGLDSGITGFERPDLNLVVVLDVSGSMSSALDTYHYDDPVARPDFGSVTKMGAANRAVAGLTDHLGPDDRLGIVLFDDRPHLARPLLPMEGVDRDELKANIMGIYPDGGTYMEGGMSTATGLFGTGPVHDNYYKCSGNGEWCIPPENHRDVVCTCPEGYACAGEVAWCIESIEDLSCRCPEDRDCPGDERWCITHMPDRRVMPDDGRANRIIFLTDAMPNIGDTSERGLLGMVERNARSGIHTTFVGIGLDFNTELVDAISKVRGANYYSVHSPAEFNQRMVGEFDFMVTPLVFGLELSIDSDAWQIETVYGSPEADESTGTILKVNTLFPSAQVDSEVRGGIILLKMHNAECEATIEAVDSWERENYPASQTSRWSVMPEAFALSLAPDDTGCFEPMALRATYESAAGELFETEVSVAFSIGDDRSFDVAENNGIRKGVLLARYAELMQSWLEHERTPADWQHDRNMWERTSLPLTVSEPYGWLFGLFTKHLEAEAAAIGDPDLNREKDILAKLLAAVAQPKD